MADDPSAGALLETLIPNSQVGPMALRLAFPRQLQAQANISPSTAAVMYDSTGTGGGSTVQALSQAVTWSHTLGASANAVLVMASSCNSGVGNPTWTVTYGGQSMTLLGYQAANNLALGGTAVFGLMNPPAGTSTVSVTASVASGFLWGTSGNSMSFVGVAGFGTPVTTAGFAGFAQVVASAPVGAMTAAAAGWVSRNVPANGYSSPQQTDRFFASVGTYGVVDGQTATSFGSPITLGTGGGPSNYWSAVAVPVLPNQNLLQNVVSSALTVGLTAGGLLSVAGQQPVAAVIPNPYVGPQALRQAYQRRPQAQANIVGWVQPDGSTPAIVGLTASGAIGDVTGAPDTITVGLTAAGAVGEVASTPDVLTVGLTAAGSLVYTQSSTGTTATVGLSASGVEGGVAGVSLPTVVGLVAGGVVGSAATGTAVVVLTAGLAAGGMASISCGSSAAAMSAALSAAGFIIGYEGGGTQIVRLESRSQVVGFESRVTVISRRETRLVTVVK